MEKELMCDFKPTLFDLKKYLKDQRICFATVGRRMGYTPQAYNYHLNKGVLTYAFIELVSKINKKTPVQVIKELESYKKAK